jgi:hypothetical protein
MQSDRHERISERAYQIWVAEGRPHGRHDEHWQRAEHEIAEEERRVAAALADRAVGATGTTKPRQPRQARSRSGATTTAPARRGRRTPGGTSSS